MSDYETLESRRPAPAVEFRGLAGDFFLIQLGNLALTIITIGIYRFWGKARYRRYLWAQTSLDGDSLDYTGTGLELFIGAILVVVLVSIPFGLLSVLMPLVVPDPAIAAGLTQLVLVTGIYWLVGVGQYRSWRYLFSRTAWRGIRSGMTEQGFAYGNFSFGLTFAQLFSLGLATPWTTTRRWNRLVQDVRIGSFALSSAAEPGPLWKPFLLVWVCVAVPAMAFIGWFAWRYGEMFANQQPTPGDPTEVLIAIGVLYLGLIVLGLLGALLFANYQSAYLKETFGKTRIGDTMALRIDVTTWEIIRYYLGNIALVVLTAGLGSMLLPYRYWSFMARRIWIDGDYDEASLMQTDLAAPGQGDGLIDAFDASSF
jgi:uncharacterized membrane protein YjgN (DUF898 family)